MVILCVLRWKPRHSAEEELEAIDVLSLQKRPHNLLVDHTRNVRPAHPAVETFTPRRERVDVTSVPSPKWTLVLSGCWRSYRP